MNVNIRQLRALDAVVRLGSFAEAARALHVTPAALSLSVKELEERIGFRLLERTTRSLRLTEAGRGYLPFVDRVLAGLQDAERYAKQVQQGLGLVRLATTQTIISTLLAKGIPDVHRQWPGVRLHPIDIAAGDIVDALQSRRTDIAIGVRLPHDEHFTSQPFFVSQWTAFVAPSHPLGRRKQIRWSDLAQTTLYMSKSSTLHLQALLGPEWRLADVQDTAAASPGLAMASTGLGVAVFPGYARPLARVSGLRPMTIQAPTIPHQLHIAIPNQPSTAAPLREIVQVLVEAVSQVRLP